VTENEVVERMLEHLDRQFPKNCPSCQSRFETLADYLRNTTHVGAPVSYDAALGDWQPDAPVGSMSLANCRCGTTLGITSSGMSLPTMWKMMGWLRSEMARRGVGASDVLRDLRAQLDAKALSRNP